MNLSYDRSHYPTMNQTGCSPIDSSHLRFFVRSRSRHGDHRLHHLISRVFTISERQSEVGMRSRGTMYLRRSSLPSIGSVSQKQSVLCSHESERSTTVKSSIIVSEKNWNSNEWSSRICQSLSVTTRISWSVTLCVLSRTRTICSRLCMERCGVVGHFSIYQPEWRSLILSRRTSGWIWNPEDSSNIRSSSSKMALRHTISRGVVLRSMGRRACMLDVSRSTCESMRRCDTPRSRTGR